MGKDLGIWDSINNKQMIVATVEERKRPHDKKEGPEQKLKVLGFLSTFKQSGDFQITNDSTPIRFR